MIIVTTHGVPGYKIEAVLGHVMGMTIRSGNLGSNIAASFRSLGGGEVPEVSRFNKLVHESRVEVMNRLWAECVNRGGNAIVGMRFDTSEVAAGFTELCAYGTAVVAVPLGEDEPGATPQSIARAKAQPGPGNWPQMEGQPPLGDREGQRPQATPGQAEQGERREGDAPERLADHQERRPQAAAPGYSPQEHQRHEEQRRQEQERPRTPEQQRPGAEDSWLDLG